MYGEPHGSVDGWDDTSNIYSFIIEQLSEGHSAKLWTYIRRVSLLRRLTFWQRQTKTKLNKG